jgi:hypothetical protein
MIMSKEAIEELGERLVRHVRDKAIWGCDAILSPDRQTKDALRWRAAAAAAGGQVPASMVIPEPVDAVVANLLLAVDHSLIHNLIRLSFTTEHGETVYLPEDGEGEMCGWYGGAGGWRDWYSNERIVDAEDFAHIAAEYGVEGIPDDPPPIVDELPMPQRAIQEFAQLLVRHVRDVAIQSCDLQLLPHSQTPMAKRWRRAAIPFEGKVPPQVLIPDCVDETIFVFLRAIDQGLLRLSFTTESGETVDLAKEGHGELAAQYMAPDGWRAKYSKERVNHDVDDPSSG